MRVTIFTDGSFDHVHHKGGWAAWVLSDEGTVVRYGSCPKRLVTQANHAELYAIYMGVTLAIREWGDNIHAFVLRSDSHCALIHAEKGALRSRIRDRRMLRLRSWLREAVRPIQAQVVTDHVKGHQDPSQGLAFLLNNKVDTLACKGRKRITGKGYVHAGEHPTGDR